jgi:hypothetical protein
MGELTPEQRDFDVSQFFDPDAPSGEPVLRQVLDPFTNEVHTPGLRITEDGRLLRKGEQGLGSESESD